MNENPPAIPCIACGGRPINWLLRRLDQLEQHGLCDSCVALLLVVRTDEGTDEAPPPS
jgi:hypothetical protein